MISVVFVMVVILVSLTCIFVIVEWSLVYNGNYIASHNQDTMECRSMVATITDFGGLAIFALITVMGHLIKGSMERGKKAAM